MIGRTMKAGDKVNVAQWCKGTYMGVRSAVVVSIDGDGRTQGTATVRYLRTRSSVVVGAVSCHPVPKRANA